MKRVFSHLSPLHCSWVFKCYSRMRVYVFPFSANHFSNSRTKLIISHIPALRAVRVSKMCVHIHKLVSMIFPSRLNSKSAIAHSKCALFDTQTHAWFHMFYSRCAPSRSACKTHNDVSKYTVGVRIWQNDLFFLHVYIYIHMGAGHICWPRGQGARGAVMGPTLWEDALRLLLLLSSVCIWMDTRILTHDHDG